MALSFFPRQPAIAFMASVILLFLAAASITSAQQPKVLAPHRPLAPRLEKRLPFSKSVVRQSATGGLWMTDPDWKASLYLKNALKTDPITVTPILYLSNGQRYALAAVTLDPSSTAIVDIGRGLESSGIAPYATLCGYVEIEYQWPWAAVTATVKNIDVVNSLIYIFGLQPSPDWHPEHMDSMPKTLPASFEGLWWKQEKNVTGFLALSNVTAQAIHATVRLTDSSDAQLASYQVTISPRGTKMLTLDDLKAAAGDAGGVYLTHDGPERGLDVNGGLEDKAAGYSARLKMQPQPEPASGSQTQPAQTLSISELGLMTGAADPMMNFPYGTVFTPYSLVRNISEQPATITPELWWMSGGSPHSATLPQMALPPHQTLNLNVPALLAAAGLKNFNGSVNLILGTEAQSAGLLMASGSVDQRNTYVFEVMPRGIAEGASKALCYWSTGNGDDTMVTLWNPADEPQDLAFTLFYSGGQYVYPISLRPRETRSFNISDILHSSIPDAAGNVLPAGLTEGSAEIAGSLGEQQQILIGLDVAVYNIKKATCGTVCWTCNGIISADIALSLFGVPVGGTASETFYETWNTGGQSTPGAAWTSSSKSIATVNSTGVVAGVSYGSFSLGAEDLYPETEGVGQYCSDNQFYCPTESFSGTASGKSNPMVQLSNTPIVPTGKPVPITATVSPTTNTMPITLTISTTSGTGSATFATGYSTMTITNTTILTIVGVLASSTPNNIQLTASIPSEGAGGILATTTFTVTGPVSGAIPVNFMQTSGKAIAGAVLEFTYTWGSSSGNLADLSNCQVEEYVTYLGSANPYVFPSPPYVADYGVPNPTTAGTPVSATLGSPGLIDDQLHPGFLKPYVYAFVPSWQVFQFQCTNYKPGTWTQLLPVTGTINISRTVNYTGLSSSPTWYYEVAKSGLAVMENLP